MSIKYLFFPLFWLIIPFGLYFSWQTINNYFIFNLKPFGYIDEHVIGKSFLSEDLLKQTEEQPSIIFVGDVLLARNVEFLMNTEGSGYPFVNLVDIFKNSNFVIGNFESAVPAKHVPTPSFVTSFSVDKKFLPLLNEIGFTHLSLANNHSFDYGEVNYQNTIQELQNVGITTFGHPQNINLASTAVIELSGRKIGILSLNDIGSQLSDDWISKILLELSFVTDYQIVYIHWGDEYVLKHNQSQGDRARFIIDSGADALIGHHPHVTQDIEIYNSKPIFYSLGNFIFDQYFSVDVNQGLLLKFSFADDDIKFKIIPVSSEGTHSQPHLMAEEEKKVFLENLARRSTPIIYDYIKAGQLILPF